MSPNEKMALGAGLGIAALAGLAYVLGSSNTSAAAPNTTSPLPTVTPPTSGGTLPPAVTTQTTTTAYGSTTTTGGTTTYKSPSGTSISAAQYALNQAASATNTPLPYP